MPSHRKQLFGKNSVISVILIPLCSTYNFQDSGGGGGSGGRGVKQEMSSAVHSQCFVTQFNIQFEVYCTQKSNLSRTHF